MGVKVDPGGERNVRAKRHHNVIRLTSMVLKVKPIHHECCGAPPGLGVVPLEAKPAGKTRAKMNAKLIQSVVRRPILTRREKEKRQPRPKVRRCQRQEKMREAVTRGSLKPYRAGSVHQSNGEEALPR